MCEKLGVRATHKHNKEVSLVEIQGHEVCLSCKWGSYNLSLDKIQ